VPSQESGTELIRDQPTTKNSRASPVQANAHYFPAFFFGNEFSSTNTIHLLPRCVFAYMLGGII
jgi:hypothetical protein